jgi:hypothetical protein
VEPQTPEAERRRHTRFPVDYPISYALTDHSEISTGMAMNLSQGGLLACLFDRWGIGTELDLEMFYTYDFQFTALKTQARIVWKDILETTEVIQYQYGIEFTGIDMEERNKLRQLLASMKPIHSNGSTRNGPFQAKPL